MNIRFLDRSERDALLTFYRDAYAPRHAVTRNEYVDWYTIQTPYYDESFFAHEKLYPVIVAEHEGSIVANWICQPSQFNYYGTPYRAWWTSNWNILPAFRCRGLGHFLLDFLLKQDVDMLMANMITPEAQRLMLNGGYSRGLLHRYIAVLSPESRELASDFNDASLSAELTSAVAPDGTIAAGFTPVDRFDDTYDHFWATVAPRMFGSPRTSRFLNWRYFADPFLTYTGVVLRGNDDQIHGMAVIRFEDIVHTRFRAARLVEFLSDEAYADSFIQSILQYARERECVFLDFHTLLTAFDAPFRSAGITRDHPVIATALPRLTQPIAHENHIIDAVLLNRRIPITAEKPLDFRYWYTTSGDADQDRKNFL